MKDKKIAITGIGIVSKAGFSKEQYWKSLLNQTDFTTIVDTFSTETYSAKKAYLITDFEPRKYIERGYIKPLDQITRYCIAAVGLALTDASLSIRKSIRDKVGIVIGSMYHGIASIFSIKDDYWNYGVTGVGPLFFPGTVFNASAGQVAIEYHAEGLNSTINNGCASGLTAVINGIDYILNNKAEVVIAGGAEMFYEFMFAKYDRLGYLSCDKNGGEECKPFDKRRNGIVLGEGACFFVLEKLENAIKRKAAIYATVQNYFLNFCGDEDNRINAITECIKNTISTKENDLSSNIDLVISDGSGDRINDRLEAKALQSVFQSNSPYVTSNKGNIGHALGASGAFNLAEAVLSIHKGEIPPIKNLDNPEFQLNFVTGSSIKKKVNNALVNAVDFNGSNATLLLSSPTASDTVDDN